MRYNFFGILLILILLSFATAMGQSSRLLRQADNRYEAKNYASAIALWKKVFDQEKDAALRQQLAFNIGEAYLRMNQLDEAAVWLNDASEIAQPPVEWLLLKASVQLRLNQSGFARKTILAALDIQPYSRQLQDMLAMIDRWDKQSHEADFPFAKLSSINTEWSDYSALWHQNRLLISSSRPGKQQQNIDGRTSEFYSGIFEFQQNQFGDFELSSDFNALKGSNIGTPAMDQLHQRIFYTRCNNNKKRCAIFVAMIDPLTGKISKSKPAPFMQNYVHYGHPFVREDGKMLYFVSDMSGGYGGKDIYRISLREDGGFGLVINMGPKINASGDELFPTVIGDSILLFAAERFSGYGGLDVYASRLTDEQAQKPILLDYPFNSQGDDFYLTLKTGSIQGWLSSNRESETNDDIYAFEAFPLRTILEGVVKEEHSGQLLADAEIAILENGWRKSMIKTDSIGYYRTSISIGSSLEIHAEKAGYFPEKRRQKVSDSARLLRQNFTLALLTYPAAISGIVIEKETRKALASEKVMLNGPGGFYLETFTNSQGEYRFDSLKPNHVYTVKVTKKGYFSESRVCRIPEARKPLLLNKQNGVDMDFELIAIQKKKEVVIHNIYYDFDKASLRESSKLELNKLVSMLRETPNVIVQINAHTDTRGSHAYNDKLSDSRAASVVNYLVSNGIDPARLVSRGFGKQNPIFPNAKSEAEHQANRRTTFTVTGTDFKPVISQNNFIPKETDLIYRVQLMATSAYFEPESYFAVLKVIIPDARFYVQPVNGIYRYEIGDRQHLPAAESLKNQVLAAGFSDCFIVPYYNGKRISMEEAKKIRP
ncbi:MAG: OmpA family protein [Bacteroidales bacterium]|nr:OmpA family protein [Bacteroidales bacterium]